MLKFVEKTIYLPAVFKKFTLSGVFNSFDGFIPISQKYGLVDTLIS